MASISLNYVPLVLSLAVLVSLIAPSTSKSNPTAKLTPELLKRVCLENGKYSTCLQTLQQDPQTQTLNLGDLTLSYVKKARNRTSSTLLILETLIGQTLERELIYKYRSCWRHYRAALADLNRAKQRLDSHNYEVTELVNTASRRVSDCDDEFEDMKFPRSSELDRSNQELTIFTDIVYGLAAELVFLP